MKKLSQIRKRDLEKYKFPGTDAAVLLIKKKIPQNELKKLFGGLSGDHRFYPTKEGWKVKFPYWYVEAITYSKDCGLKIEQFKREKKGWDHEHCSFCRAHIHIGELAYTYPHEKGGVYVICEGCAEKCKDNG